MSARRASAAWPVARTPRTPDALVACARGELAPNVALARLAIAGDAPDGESAARLLQAAIRARVRRGAPAEAQRLRTALRQLERDPAGFATVVAIAADHDRPARPGADPIAHWAGVFDRACARSPEASVALYSLGSGEILSAATAEIAAWIEQAGLLGRERCVLDLGCGVGRMLEALAPRVRFVVGVEISTVMAEAARARAAGLGNAAVLRVSGRDLAAFGDESFDLVVAVDSFPYLVAAGQGLAARHIEEAQRVLRPRGALVILNYSYRGDLDRDRADMARLAARRGFVVRKNGVRAFQRWDAAAFELRRLEEAKSFRSPERKSCYGPEVKREKHAPRPYPRS